MKENAFIFYAISLLLSVCCIAFCGSTKKTMSPQDQGPGDYLWALIDAMKSYHKEYGCYPKELNLLEPVLKEKGFALNIVRPDEKDFTYKIVRADEKSFLVISHNTLGKRDYQITEKSFRPTWHFADDKERKETFNKLIGNIEKYKHDPSSSPQTSDGGYEFWAYLSQLSEFSYNEVDDYLFKLMKETEDSSVLLTAACTLAETAQQPSREAIDKLLLFDEEKLCMIMRDAFSVFDMLKRSDDKESIKASIKLLDWTIQNCFSQPFNQDLEISGFEKVKNTLNEKLSNLNDGKACISETEVDPKLE